MNRGHQQQQQHSKKKKHREALYSSTDAKPAKARPVSDGHQNLDERRMPQQQQQQLQQKWIVLPWENTFPSQRFAPAFVIIVYISRRQWFNGFSFALTASQEEEEGWEWYPPPPQEPKGKEVRGMDHEENNKDGSTAAVVPLLGQFGRSLSNLFTRCATPGQVIVLSIDDITNGLGDEVEYLLDGNKRGSAYNPRN
ncbi:hypothetical protein DAPPUDRAFT_250380 [Daphnia pulex]|uniref:Uncharacterized protein n=1 Tax=Daphnia pulex TaxID=6669 RepID=E9GYF6_DAPPU|nr:hypothetical protein DAPPUDRAFT_250380 [Daphnia pulex]|eukprot:EFX75376.1 hypothetical protein DAPPUDRAFT_250380 [Daphnia pulex]